MKHSSGETTLSKRGIEDTYCFEEGIVWQGYVRKVNPKVEECEEELQSFLR